MKAEIKNIKTAKGDHYFRVYWNGEYHCSFYYTPETKQAAKEQAQRTADFMNKWQGTEIEILN